MNTSYSLLDTSNILLTMEFRYNDGVIRKNYNPTRGAKMKTLSIIERWVALLAGIATLIDIIKGWL